MRHRAGPNLLCAAQACQPWDGPYSRLLRRTQHRALRSLRDFLFRLAETAPKRRPYLKTFTSAQLDTLVLLSLKLFGYGAGLFLIFYGTGWIVRGWLMILSGYFPKLLGLLMIVGGLGFVARTLTIVLAPQYSSNVMLMLLIPGGGLLGLWLLVRGVDPDKWRAKLTAP